MRQGDRQGEGIKNRERYVDESGRNDKWEGQEGLAGRKERPPGRPLAPL